MRCLPQEAPDLSKSSKGAEVGGGGGWTVVSRANLWRPLPYGNSSFRPSRPHSRELGLQRDRELSLDWSLMNLGQKTETQRKTLRLLWGDLNRSFLHQSRTRLRRSQLQQPPPEPPHPAGPGQPPPLCQDWVEGTHRATGSHENTGSQGS